MPLMPITMNPKILMRKKRKTKVRKKAKTPVRTNDTAILVKKTPANILRRR